MSWSMSINSASLSKIVFIILGDNEFGNGGKCIVSVDAGVVATCDGQRTVDLFAGVIVMSMMHHFAPVSVGVTDVKVWRWFAAVGAGVADSKVVNGKATNV